MIDAITNNVFTVLLVIMAILLLTCMIKAILGPRVADRVVCVNMMGTIVIVIIAILAVKMEEGYLADISIIYAMISFLAVVILCKVYMGVYMERIKMNKKTDKIENLEEGEENHDNNK